MFAIMRGAGYLHGRCQGLEVKHLVSTVIGFAAKYPGINVFLIVHRRCLVNRFFLSLSSGLVASLDFGPFICCCFFTINVGFSVIWLLGTFIIICGAMILNSLRYGCWLLFCVLLFTVQTRKAGTNVDECPPFLWDL